MKKQKIKFLATVTSLLLLSTVSLAKNVSVNAEPAPIFTPILRDIQNQLPKGMVMRLPSRVNIRNLPLYAQVVTSNPGRFAVLLNTQPNCIARVCQLGIISVAENPESNNIQRSRPIFSKSDIERVRAIRQRDPQTWTEADKQYFQRSAGAILERSPITLKNGVEGFFIVKNATGASTPAALSVIWAQDGLNYHVWIKGGVDSDGNAIQDQKSEIINLAISMANEIPIQPR
jgi:hypothetical protein